MFCQQIIEVDSVRSRHVSPPIDGFIYPRLFGRDSSVDIGIVRYIKPFFSPLWPFVPTRCAVCSHSDSLK